MCQNNQIFIESAQYTLVKPNFFYFLELQKDPFLNPQLFHLIPFHIASIASHTFIIAQRPNLAMIQSPIS